MKMKRRKVADSSESIQREVSIEMFSDVVEDSIYAILIVVG